MTLDGILLGIATGFYGLAALATWIFLLNRKETFIQASGGGLAIGILFHAASLSARAILTQHAPWSNLYESISAIAFSMGLCALVADRFPKFELAKVIVLPLVFLASLYAFSLDKSIGPLMPALASPWLAVHVLTGIIAYGAFAISAAGAALLLIQKRFQKFGEGRLPTSEVLDELTYRWAAFGFLFQTLLLGTGAIWAEQAWGAYWSWDPKETWALVTWLVYLIYLHLRLWKGWRGPALASVCVIGFAAVVFTYFGVGFFLVGFHSYIAP